MYKERTVYRERTVYKERTVHGILWYGQKIKKVIKIILFIPNRKRLIAWAVNVGVSVKNL